MYVSTRVRSRRKLLWRIAAAILLLGLLAAGYLTLANRTVPQAGTPSLTGGCPPSPAPDLVMVSRLRAPQNNVPNNTPFQRRISDQGHVASLARLLCAQPSAPFTHCPFDPGVGYAIEFRSGSRTVLTGGLSAGGCRRLLLGSFGDRFEPGFGLAGVRSTDDQFWASFATDIGVSDPAQLLTAPYVSN